MKKIILLLSVFLSVCICYAQNMHSERIVKRLENKLYIIENGINYNIDETKIIAKLKPQRELPRTLCEKSWDLGFDILEIPVPDGMMVEDYVSLIVGTGDFEYVDYNTYGKYFFTPNDSLIGNGTGFQWYLDRINAYDAWNITTGNSSIKVAVLDSGVDCHSDIHYGSDNYTNLDLPDGYNYPYNTNYSAPTNYHGTMVAGIIGAKTNNNRGLAGISGGNNSEGIAIIPYTIGIDEPSTDYVISAISNAVEKGAKIINMSFGFAYNNGVDNAITNAYNQGVTIICSTGNTYNSFIHFPSSHPYTIAVGATNQSNQRLDLSNYGSGLDLVAPGVDIKSTSLNNSYYSDYGTSFSAPQVTGVVALMLSVNPNLTPSQITSFLRNTCTKLSGYSYTNGWNSEVGYGLLNAYDAVVSLMDFYISGSTIPCSNSVYSISSVIGTPLVNFSVSWYFKSQEPSLNNLISWNSLSPYQCSISNTGHTYIKDTLVAKISLDGNQILMLKKAIDTGVNFTGFFSGSFNGIVPIGQTYPNIPSTNLVSGGHYIFQGGYDLTLNSNNFIGATVSYSGSAIQNFSNNGQGTISFRLSNALTAPKSGIIEAYNGCDVYKFYFTALPPMNPIDFSLQIYPETNGYEVSLMQNVDEDENASQLSELEWDLTIFNAMTGLIVYENKVLGSSHVINTTGWLPGVYIVVSQLENKILTQKITVQ